MHELIDEIVEHLTYDDDLSDDSRITLETIRLRCLGKLAIEKEQMISAYKKFYTPFSFDHIGELEQDFEQYYNETYGK